MSQRDLWKEKAKDLALLNSNSEASPLEIEAWNQYKLFRNTINNRKKFEENAFKAVEITENLLLKLGKQYKRLWTGRPLGSHIRLN